jgi:iron complex transport system substrate-binding protein
VLGGAMAGLAATALGGRHGFALQATPAATPPVPNGVQPDGSWVFTDDRKVTLVSAAVPSRIVAQTSAAAALYDFGVQVVGIYGPSKNDDGSPSFEAGNLDINAIEVLGDYGTDSLEIDIEKFVQLNPDLVVDMIVYEDTFWYLSGDARSRVEALKVPIAGISMEKVSLLTIIERFEQLAGALGADLLAPAISEAKATHAESEAALTAAIASKPGLSLISISPTPDAVYVCSPRYMPDLHYFADLGLDVVDHQTDDFFELLSWEEINRYPADIILLDARKGYPTPDELSTSVPIWNTLPAVQAGQLGNWYAGAPSSYGRLAPIMDELAALIASADPNVV